MLTVFNNGAVFNNGFFLLNSLGGSGVGSETPPDTGDGGDGGSSILSGIGMIYGAYNFTPVPIITHSKQFIKTGNQRIIGSTHKFVLEGTLITLTGGGLPVVMSKIQTLKEAFNADGKYFAITCGDTYLVEGYPRVLNLQFNPTPDNWVQSADYTLELEFDNEPADENIDGFGEDTAYFTPFIQDFSESWNLEFDNRSNYYSLPTSSGLDVGPYLLRLTHELSAVGKSHYSGPGLTGTLDKPAWQQAKDYITLHQGLDKSKVENNPSFNFSPNIFGYYDYLRSQTTDIKGGSHSMTETWAVLMTGHGGIQRNAIEDFSVQITKNSESNDSVNIQGRIIGLESRVYNTGVGDFTVNENKHNAAQNYFNSLNSLGYIYSRAQALAADEDINLNPEPAIEVIGRSPNQGVITYNYAYDDRPTNCITGAKFESISISQTNPTDVFNEFVILGRVQGPIFQNLNTVTPTRKSVSIDVLMEEKPGCEFNMDSAPRAQVNAILCSIYSDLTSSYDKVYQTSNNESWNPKTGRFSKQVEWIATDCDNIPNISVC